MNKMDGEDNLIRCFIAFEVPDNIKKNIVEFQNKIEESCLKLISYDNMHITLNFLGNVNSSVISFIRDKLKDIRNYNIRKQEIIIKDLGFFPSYNYVRVLWAGAHGLDYYSNVIYEKIRIGEKIDKGHLTIARIKCKPSQGFFDKIKYNENIMFGSFIPDKAILFKSNLTKAGALYEKIDEFYLF
jgi:2'-5' RNA ligase